QDENDPALPIVEKIRAEFPERVKIVVDTSAVGPNGRLCNIYNASRKATGEIFLFSDSDVFLPANYLRAIVAPFADSQVGVSCTLYKAWRPHNIAERLELLSLNTDFIPSMVFAYVTKMTIACPGASQAIRRSGLEEIGGLKPLADYLVEDFELGRRVREKGYKIHFVPLSISTEVNLNGFRDWWRHQVYWDHNTRAANASGFLATVLIRAIPFAFFYWLVDGEMAIPVLVAIIFWRIYTAVFNAFFLKDPDTIRSLWLLPIRDLLAFCTWAASFMKKNIYWKGREFEIQNGRMIEISDRHRR
ncbi:MAG: glycosyltransferase, partial [Deltaproteobacteria bacterium]|nr:glycosyltransferase [Deltaproteobacteria bacterium]